MRPDINNIRTIGDATTLFRWNVIFAKFPSVGTWPSSDALNFRCESAELPKGTLEKAEVNIRGHKVLQPGKMAYENTLPLTFIETVDNVVAKVIRQWREICWQSRTGTSYSKAQVEAVILLQRLDNQDNAIYEYKLVGAFMEDHDFGGTLDGITPDSLKPVITLSYDYYLDKPLGEGA